DAARRQARGAARSYMPHAAALSNPLRHGSCPPRGRLAAFFVPPRRARGDFPARLGGRNRNAWRVRRGSAFASGAIRFAIAPYALLCCGISIRALTAPGPSRHRWLGAAIARYPMRDHANLIRAHWTRLVE